ncbi:MAG: hypothetical protein ACTTJH_02630 [Bacteroidales bacterium]
MKKMIISGTFLCILLSMTLMSFATGDWRKGIWNRDISEHLLCFNVETIPVLTEAFKSTTPWAFGFNTGYEYKIRPSIIHSRISFGFGGHFGVSRYFGSNINTTVIGHELNQRWDSYKSFTEIPLLLDVNMYFNFKTSNIFIGVAGGINLMLGERDASLNQIGPSSTSELERQYLVQFGKEVDIVSIQLNENNVSLNHIIPTFRAIVGYTYEFSQDWSMRIKVGVDYQMKYADEYKGFHLDSDYYEYYHRHDSPQMLNPFFSIGLLYSL